MMRPGLTLVGTFTVLALGCVTDQPKTATVVENPFGSPSPPQVQQKVAFAPSSVEVAARVDTMGRKLVKANTQLGVQPKFVTIGAPQPEIFHRGTSDIIITEGLVKQCVTEGQLAAVLCNELGKMVAQREAVAGPASRDIERRPPLDLPVGNDYGGSFGASDQLHRAELGKFDEDRRRKAAAAATPPDPRMLARSYLMKAGYAAGELDGVVALLATASESNDFAKQMTTPAQPRQ
jgi:hypothetical protein